MRANARMGWALLLCLSLAGCGGQAASQAVDLPQKASLYGDASQVLAGPPYQRQLMPDFQERLFAPWSVHHPDAVPAPILSVLEQVKERPGVGENLRPRSRAWAESMVLECDLGRFPSLVYPALTLRPSDLRLLPTDKPLFRGDGQGYPFDRLQESRLPGNTPVAVLHISRDGIWAMVSSPIAVGWMRMSDLAQVNPEQMKAWRSGRYAAIIKDGVKIADAAGRAHFLAGIGAVLPLADEDQGGITVLFGAADGEGNLRVKTARLSRRDAAPMPMPLTVGNVAALADAMMGQPYGWGGFLDNRDCSALVKDIFTPFGLWLPRNSGEQAGAGAMAVDLSGMRAVEKEETIARRGLPFASLLWMRGHIMLYLGSRPEGTIVLHDIWAAGTGSAQGQALPVGRVVISTLDLRQTREEGQPNQGGDLRRHLRSLILLVPRDQSPR